MRRRLVIGLALLGLLLGGAVFAHYHAAGDWPALAPLEPVAQPFAPAPNSADLVAEAARVTEALKLPEAMPFEADALSGPPEGGWPEHPAGQAAFDALVAASGFDLSFPPLKPDVMPSLLPFLRLGTLRLWRATERHHAGDAAGAAADIAGVVRVAHRVQHGGAAMVGAMVGVALEERALQLAEAILKAGGALPGLEAALAEAEALPSAFEGGLVGEAAILDAHFVDLGNRSVDELFAMADGQPLEPADGDGFGAPRWMYDPDKTRAASHAHLAAWRAAARRSSEARTLPEPPNYWPEWHPGKYVDNPVGRILLAVAAPDWSKYLAKEDALRARRAGVRERLPR